MHFAVLFPNRTCHVFLNDTFDAVVADIVNLNGWQGVVRLQSMDGWPTHVVEGKGGFHGFRNGPAHPRGKIYQVTCVLDTQKRNARQVAEPEIETQEDKLCNLCGKSRLCGNSMSPSAYGLEAIFTSGYDSQVLPDGNIYFFGLCEECLVSLMEIFVLPTTVESYL